MNNPYTLEPVYGEKFYGRERLIEQIEERRRVLVICARRMGGTSLLRQMEYKLEQKSEISLYMPLGNVKNPGDFESWLEYACYSKSKLLEEIGFNIEKVFNEAKDIQRILWNLDRNLREHEKRLFLLIDEADALAELNADFLKALRASFEMAPQIRLVLVARHGIPRKIQEKSSDWSTTAFFDGFEIYRLPSLNNTEAEDLIKQRRPGSADDDGLVEVDEDTVEKIRKLTNNHPFFIQSLCFTLFEEPNRLVSVSEEHLNDVYDRINETRIVEDSYNRLSLSQKDIVNLVSESSDLETNRTISFENLEQQIATSSAKRMLRTNLYELTVLSYLKEEPEREYSISNYFLKRWLRENIPPGGQEDEGSF